MSHGIPDFPVQRLHDLPPKWDGVDPQKNLEPYFKVLKGWLITTRCPKNRRGLSIMNEAEGALRRMIDTLDIDALTKDDSGERTLALIEAEYSEFKIVKKPIRIEEALYDNDRCRKKNEDILSYITRRKHVSLS